MFLFFYEREAVTWVRSLHKPHRSLPNLQKQQTGVGGELDERRWEELACAGATGVSARVYLVWAFPSEPSGSSSSVDSSFIPAVTLGGSIVTPGPLWASPSSSGKMGAAPPGLSPVPGRVRGGKQPGHQEE